MSVQERISHLQQWLQDHIIGQSHLTDRLLIALLADGHLLVEGAPGLAKTKAIKTLADGIEGNFQRIQFTPDLLPTDITGTDIYNPNEHRFEFQPGPIFHNLLLADEINRAPAKVQSALLEAMAERQVSMGNKTYSLPTMFLVMATQNPIEQEGTYPLPEAQLDRFLMKVNVTYPDSNAEAAILQLARQEAISATGIANIDAITTEDIMHARKSVLDIYMAAPLDDYIVQLTMSTRRDHTEKDTEDTLNNDLDQWIDYGVSPRATIALDRCARAHAWLAGKDHVSPDDIQTVIHDVYRHRLLLSYEAEAQGITADQVIDLLVQTVPVN